MKGVQINPPEKTTLKKPSLIRVKVDAVSTFIKDEVERFSTKDSTLLTKYYEKWSKVKKIIGK